MPPARRTTTVPRPRARRVLGYARVSSEAQVDGSSLGDQQEAIRRYAKATHGMDVDRMFVEAESGIHEKFERRQEIQALMAEVREGDLVVAYALDRWSRDPEFTWRSVREIHEAGAHVYFVNDACDPSTPEGDSALHLKVMVAREEHKNIKRRLVGTRRLLKDRGYYSEGLPPWGYRREKGEKGPVLVVDDEAAKLVREAFRLCIAGQSIGEIAQTFGLTYDKIKDALHNRHYLGEQRDGSLSTWIKGKHAPLVDAETFTRAQAAIAGRRHGFRPGADSETKDWVLREVARCGACGARMSSAYSGSPHARRYYYRCFRSKARSGSRCSSLYVKVREVEEQAFSLILARLEELREELALEPKTSKETAPKGISERRERLQQRRQRYLDQNANGLTTLEELRAQLAKLDAERTRLEAEEQTVKRPSRLAEPDVRRAVLRQVGTIRRAWAKATPAERRQIVGHLAHGVRLTRGEAPEFQWRTAEELAEQA